MVNIVIISDSVFQMHIIINGSKNIFSCNVFRDQVMNIPGNRCDSVFQSIIFFQNLFKNRIVNKLCNTQFSGILDFRQERTDIHHHIGKNFDLTFFSLNPYVGNSRILNSVCQLSCNSSTLFCYNLPCRSIHHIFSQLMTYDTFVKMKLLIKLITSNLGKVISSRIEEHCHDKAFGTFYSQWLTRTNFLI